MADAELRRYAICFRYFRVWPLSIPDSEQKFNIYFRPVKSVATEGTEITEGGSTSGGVDQACRACRRASQSVPEIMLMHNEQLLSLASAFYCIPDHSATTDVGSARFFVSSDYQMVTFVSYFEGHGGSFMSRYAFVVVTACVLASQVSGREIALSEIHSTGGQKELKRVSSGLKLVDNKMVEETHRPAMAKLERGHGGSSNTFLVDAPNISDAVAATAKVLIGFRSASNPVPPEYKLSGNNWLVVYMGYGQSDPTSWVVQTVSVDKTTIRFTYRKAKRGFATEDARPYYFWIPLGALDPAAYALELCDSDLTAVTLMRRVEVKAP